MNRILPGIGLLAPALLIAGLAGRTAAQDPTDAPVRERIDAADHAVRMMVREVNGQIGPPLPPVYADSPRDDFRYADRFPVGSSYEGDCDGTGPLITSRWISKDDTGTGKGEFFQFMVPTNYDPQADPVPLVIGYHGYGNSANSVALQSTLDEEADARGWFFLAPTGLDDKLFGSMACQTHIELTIQWMLDNYNIDPDRIYMVGYSMGGGVSASFAARHRDPDGIMIAAVASACGTFDWTLAYEVHPQQVKDLLENPFNFGGPPSEFPFSYWRSSGVYFDPQFYPPSGNDYDPHLSMGRNLVYTPTYVAYDTTDQIFSVRAESQAFINLMSEQGVQPVTQINTGTLDPCDGTPAPHSWAVFDMPAVFAFLEDKVVDRYPDVVEAMLDRPTAVSYLDVTQDTEDAFTWFHADTTGGLSLLDAENAAVISVDASLAGPGLAGAGPFAIDDDPLVGESHDLRLHGFDDPAAYLLDASTSEYVTGTLSEPLEDALVHEVGLGGLHVDLVTDPVWTGDILTTPDPVAFGASTQLDIDLPPTSANGFLVVALSEGLVTVKNGNKVTALPFSPSLLLLAPMDANGDLSLPIDVPNDPGLAGAVLYFQTVGLAGSAIDSITNMWVMHIE